MEKQTTQIQKQPQYKKTSLRNTANAFATVALVFACITIITMPWMIPMSLSIKHDIRDNKPVPLALSICYIIFGGIFAVVAGILLCVDFGTNKPE